MQITSIILAGGKSRRMGTDKALLELEGKPLLEKAIGICKAFSSKILISSNNLEHGIFGLPVVRDEIENCGPMGGVYSCLKKSESNWNFIISVDSPFVEPEFLEFLISNIKEYDAIVPVSSKGEEPLIALYNISSLVELKKMMETGNFKMQNFIHSVSTNWIDAQSWEKRYPKLFYNLNRPEDLYFSFG